MRPVSSDGGGAGATSVDATTDTRLQKSLARIGTESLELLVYLFTIHSDNFWIEGNMAMGLLSKVVSDKVSGEVDRFEVIYIFKSWIYFRAMD